MTYTEFIIGVENNIAKANCDKLNMEEYEEKQKQIYKQIRTDAIDDFIHECDKHCEFYSGKNKNITRKDILKIAEN